MDGSFDIYAGDINKNIKESILHKAVYLWIFTKINVGSFYFLVVC